MVIRRTRYDLRKAEEREHVLLGYQIAVDHLDNVIRIVRGSSSRANARENLFAYFGNKSVEILTGRGERTETLKGVKLDAKRYGISGDLTGLSYIQIDAILELQLHRLTRLSIDDILKELGELRVKIADLREILSSEKKLKQVIVTELRDVQKQFGDARRTQIVDAVDEIKVEDLIADTDMAITISHAGISSAPRWTSTAISPAEERDASARAPAKKTSSSISSWPRRTATFSCSAPRAGSTGSRCTRFPRRPRPRAGGPSAAW